MSELRAAMQRILEEAYRNSCGEPCNHIDAACRIFDWAQAALAATPPAGERGERNDWRPVSRAIHETLLDMKWPAYGPDDFAFLTLALAGEVGELANVAKKMVREDWGSIKDLWFAPGDVDLPDDLRWKLTEELADVRIYLELVANCVEIDLDDACRTIIRDKLLPRWPQCKAAVDALDADPRPAPTVEHEPMNHMGNDGWQVRCRGCFAMWPCEKATPAPEPPVAEPAGETCSACGNAPNPMDTRWRWNGDGWEHKCGHPQAGYFEAVPAPAPEPPGGVGADPTKSLAYRITLDVTPSEKALLENVIEQAASDRWHNWCAQEAQLQVGGSRAEEHIRDLFERLCIALDRARPGAAAGEVDDAR